MKRKKSNQNTEDDESDQEQKEQMNNKNQETINKMEIHTYNKCKWTVSIKTKWQNGFLKMTHLYAVQKKLTVHHEIQTESEGIEMIFHRSKKNWGQ